MHIGRRIRMHTGSAESIPSHVDRTLTKYVTPRRLHAPVADLHFHAHAFRRSISIQVVYVCFCNQLHAVTMEYGPS